METPDSTDLSFSDFFGSKETAQSPEDDDFFNILTSFTNPNKSGEDDSKSAGKESTYYSSSENRSPESEEEVKVPAPDILKADEATALIKRWQRLEELEELNQKQNIELSIYEEKLSKKMSELFELQEAKTALEEKYESIDKERTSLNDKLNQREAELSQFKGLVKKQFNDDDELRDLQKKLAQETRLRKKAEKDLQQSTELLNETKGSIRMLKSKNSQILTRLFEFSKTLKRNGLLSSKWFQLMKDMEENCGPTKRKKTIDELMEESSLSADESNSMTDETSSPVKEESVSINKEGIKPNPVYEDIDKQNSFGNLESCPGVNMNESKSNYLSCKTQNSSNERLTNNQNSVDKTSTPSPDSNFPNVCSEVDSLGCEDVEISEACFDDIKKGITGLVLKSEHFVPLSPIPRSPSPRIITRINKNVKIQKIEHITKKFIKEGSSAPLNEKGTYVENRPKSSPEYATRRNILSHQTSGGFEPHIAKPADDNNSSSCQSSLGMNAVSQTLFPSNLHYISSSYSDDKRLKIVHQGPGVFDFVYNEDNKLSVCELLLSDKKCECSSRMSNESISNSLNVSALPSQEERKKSVLSLYMASEKHLKAIQSSMPNDSVKEDMSVIKVLIGTKGRLEIGTSQLEDSISTRNINDSSVMVEKYVDIILDKNDDETVEDINNDNQPHVSSSCDITPSKNITPSKYPVGNGVHLDSIKDNFTETEQSMQKALSFTKTLLTPEIYHDSTDPSQADITKNKSSDKIRKLSHSSIENPFSNDMITDPPSETKMMEIDRSKLSIESRTSVKMSDGKNMNTSVDDSLNLQQEFKIYNSDEESKITSDVDVLDSLEQENCQNIQNENISSPSNCDINSGVARSENEIVSPHKSHINFNCKLSPIKPNVSTESQLHDIVFKKQAIKRQENIQLSESGCSANSMETEEINKSSLNDKSFRDVQESSPKKQEIEIELPESQFKTESVRESNNSHNDVTEIFSKCSSKLFSENSTGIEIDTNDNKIVEMADVHVDNGKNHTKENGQLYNVFNELGYSVQDTKISLANDVAEIQKFRSEEEKKQTEKLENKELPVINSDEINFTGHSSQEIQHRSAELKVNSFNNNTLCEYVPIKNKVSCLDEQNMTEKILELDEFNKPSSMIENSENCLANNVQVPSKSLKPKRKKKNSKKISIRQGNRKSDTLRKTKKKKLGTCRKISDSSAVLPTGLNGSAICNETFPDVKNASIKRDVPTIEELNAKEVLQPEKNSEINEFNKPSSMIENSKNCLANNVQVPSKSLKPERKKKNSKKISIKQGNRKSDRLRKTKKKKLDTCQNISDSSAILATGLNGSAICHDSLPEVNNASILDVPAIEELNTKEELQLPSLKNSVSSLSENDNKIDEPNMIKKNSERNESDEPSSVMENSKNYLANNDQVASKSLKTKCKRKNANKISIRQENQPSDILQRRKKKKLDTCQNVSDSSEIIPTEFNVSSNCKKSLLENKDASINIDVPAIEELSTKKELPLLDFKNSVPSLSEIDANKTGDVPCFSKGKQIISSDIVEPTIASGVDDLPNAQNNVLESSDNAEKDKFIYQPALENLHIVHAEVHCSMDSTKDNEVLNTVFENEGNHRNNLLNKPELLADEAVALNTINNFSSVSLESGVKNESGFKDDKMIVDSPLYQNCKDHDDESVKNRNMLTKKDKVENISAASVNECTLNRTPVSDCGETLKPQVQQFKIIERRNSIQSTISENESPLVIVEDIEVQHSEPVSMIDEDVAEPAMLTNKKSAKKNRKRKKSNRDVLNKKRKSKNSKEDLPENILVSIYKSLKEISRIKIQDFLVEDSHFKIHLHTLTSVIINPSNASDTASALYEIFHYLSDLNNDPLLSFFNQRDNSVFFPLSEKCIVAALPLIERKKKPHLAGLIPTAITSLHYLVLGKQEIPKKGLGAFCRVLTGLCKSLNNKKKPMMLCFDLIKNKHPFAPFLIANVVGVWPELFRSTDDTGDIEFLLLNCIAYSVRHLKKEKSCNLTSADWKHCNVVFSEYLVSSAEFDVMEKTKTLLGYLKQLMCSEPSENDYMVTESIVILSALEGWDWAKKNFLNNFLKSLMKYATTMDNKRAFSLLCELYVDISLLAPEYLEPHTYLESFFSAEDVKGYVKDCVAELWLKFVVLKKVEIPIELKEWVGENEENLLGTEIEVLLKRRLMADCPTFTETDIISDS